MNHIATREELRRGATADITVHPRMCPICEANCGLLVEADSRTKRLIGIRGDDQDPLSQGFLCAKGYAWTELHDDPNLIKTPLIKRDGKFVEATWEEAFDLIDQRLGAIRKEHGANSIGFYIGNPIAHKPGLLYYTPPLLEILGSMNVYSASSVDTTPKFLSSALMFGSCDAVAVPDVDRTDFFVIHGANPAVSNGSLMTAPGMPKRMKAIQARGGKVIVIDPRRTETAEIADQHIAIRPGTDAYLLLAIINVLFAENLVRLRHLEGKVRGIDTIRALAAEYPPERVTAACTVPADVIRQLARQFAAADGAIWYGRFGTCTQSFGTISSWLQDAINVLTGNVDRSGGVMFPVGILVLGSIPWRTSGLPLLVVDLVLASLVGAAIGLTLGTLVTPARINILFALILTPFLFTGCSQYPWPTLHRLEWFQWLTTINPLTYASEGMRAALVPSVPHMRPYVSIVMLLVSLAIFSATGIRGFLRRALD